MARWTPKAGLRGRRLEDALGDVEVRVDALDIVQVLELLHEAQDLASRTLVLDLKRRLRHHRDLGRGNRDPGRLDRLAHSVQILGRARDLERGAVELDV